MQNHAKLCFAHKSLVQAWRIKNFGRFVFSEWFASKVKIAKKQQQQISTYVFDRFTNFLCIFVIMHFFAFTRINFRLLSDYHKHTIR